jgi:hypothetical protein
MTFKKFLVAGTVLCLTVAPAISQDRGTAAAIDASRANAATVADIDKRDMDAYQQQMRAALTLTDTRRRDAAVTSARQQLAQTTRKPLTAGTIAELDGLLDIGGVSPQLGASA